MKFAVSDIALTLELGTGKISRYRPTVGPHKVRKEFMKGARGRELRIDHTGQLGLPFFSFLPFPCPSLRTLRLCERFLLLFGALE